LLTALTAHLLLRAMSFRLLTMKRCDDTGQ
jgi:hypothetical protein